MNQPDLTTRACEWCYRGVWGKISRYFLVPKTPPNLPTFEGETVEYLRPSLEFLSYRKFLFWIGLFIVDVLLIVCWIVFSVWWPMAGLITAPLWIVIIVAPDVIAYIAIHLAYDTTWYVLTDRSMRIRRGIWTIQETTITFENIQNVNVVQGPLQRWFGFANLSVSTAGGGGGAHGEGQSAFGHHGWMEGINNATELRERILSRSQHTAGLGDDPEFIASKLPRAFSTRHIQLLREIEALTAQLANAPNSSS